MKAIAIPILALALSASAAGAQMAPPAPEDWSPKVTKVALATATGVHTLKLEVAESLRAQHVGLSGRGRLAPRHGMIYDFGPDKRPTMWMGNVENPLDMVFLNADGVVVHTHTWAAPFDRTRIVSPAPARFVLELRAGQVDAMGVDLGDRLLRSRRGS